jgi:hypothetical protein
MKFSKNIFFLILFSFLIFVSCKNDLKLNAPYKEYPTIYAILNPQDPIQMIRINKVFLGEGDANKMAQVSDSINYPAGELLITLKRYVAGVQTSATPSNPNGIITFRDSIIQAGPGTFNTSQRVYVSSDKLYTSGQYVLTVLNTKTKNVFTAKTDAFDCVQLSGYTPLCNPPYPVDPALGQADNTSFYVNYGKPQSSYSIWYRPNAAAIYQLTMRFHYVDSLISGNNAYGIVDFAFPNQLLRDVTTNSQGTILSNIFKGSELYAAVGNILSKNPSINANISGRRMDRVEFTVYASNQDYADYLQFAAPSLSIAQDKPLYSNFANHDALGIFAWKTRLNIVKEMATEFKTQFAIDPNTCRYKFYQMPQLVLAYCP